MKDIKGGSCGDRTLAEGISKAAGELVNSSQFDVRVAPGGWEYLVTQNVVGGGPGETVPLSLGRVRGLRWFVVRELFWTRPDALSFWLPHAAAGVALVALAAMLC